MQATACLEALAKGLRRDFHSAAKSFAPLLLDKFKDKNSGVCCNTAAALGAMHRHVRRRRSTFCGREGLRGLLLLFWAGCGGLWVAKNASFSCQ